MPGKLFQVDVVTPEAIIWSGGAQFLAARTTEGDIGILADHEATMAALATGPVEIHDADGDVTSIGIHGGFLQIFSNSVTLLTDRAEMTEGGREEAIRLAEELKEAEHRALEEAEQSEESE
jgi:F-type H+-transporting ATPase subunit epsilon